MWSSVKIVFAVLTGNFSYLTFNEARECFKNAWHGHHQQVGRPKTKLLMFSEDWKKCFLRWLDLCGEDRKELTGAFFTVERHLSPKSLGVEIKQEAGLRLLATLTDWRCEKQRKFVWSLSHQHWGYGCPLLKVNACAKREAFAASMLGKAMTTRENFDFRDAEGFAYSEELKIRIAKAAGWKNYSC